MFKKPNEPNPTPDPVPLPGSEPHASAGNQVGQAGDPDLGAAGDPTPDEIAALRQNALKDDASNNEDVASESFLMLGDTVFFGKGDGYVAPAIVTYVYPPAANDAPINLHVDLHVIGRHHDTKEHHVPQHMFVGPLNGWAFRTPH